MSVNVKKALVSGGITAVAAAVFGVEESLQLVSLGLGMSIVQIMLDVSRPNRPAGVDLRIALLSGVFFSAALVSWGYVVPAGHVDDVIAKGAALSIGMIAGDAMHSPKVS